MRPNERRAAIFDALCIRRQDTVENLTSEFGVSEKTIRRDVEEQVNDDEKSFYLFSLSW